MLKYKIPQIVTLTRKHLELNEQKPGLFPLTATNPILLNSLIFKKQNRKITAKEKGTVVNQDYRSSFIESRTDDVMKLRMT